MNSLTDLRKVVDVVIGVDTHVQTHSAAVVDTATGGVLGEITVEATPEGYVELVEFANSYAALRA
jgi:transposase